MWPELSLCAGCLLTLFFNILLAIVKGDLKKKKEIFTLTLNLTLTCRLLQTFIY